MKAKGILKKIYTYFFSTTDIIIAIIANKTATGIVNKNKFKK